MLGKSNVNVCELLVKAGVIEKIIKKDCVVITKQMRAIAKAAAIETYKAIIKSAEKEECPHCKGEDKECEYCKDKNDADAKPICPPGVPLCQ